jgi:MFS family permease
MTDQPLFCVYHPSRTTTLRCNRCGQPICTSCAILTPVGYRCKVCVRQQQKVFETAYWYDFLIAFVVAGVICGAGSLLGSLLGFFVILVAALVGTVAARAIQWAVRHRRSRYLWVVSAVGAVLGSIPIMIPTALLLLVMRDFSWRSLLALGVGLLWPGVYLVIAVGSLVANLKGFRL